jgi:hypothetical protein
MLDSVLKFFADEVNGYLQSRTGVVDEKIVLSAIVDENGKYAIKDDSIGMYIINIEEDGALKNQLPESTYVNGQHVVLEPSVRLNIFVMFAANFKHYDQALKYISYILTYFQANRLFVPEKFAAMDKGLERLVVDFQALNYDQLNQIWAYLGAKQLPSVVYRVGILSIQDQAQSDIRPPVHHVKADVGAV